MDAVPLLNFNDDSKLQKLAELKDAFDFQARGIEVVVSVSRVDKGRRENGIKCIDKVEKGEGRRHRQKCHH